MAKKIDTSELLEKQFTSNNYGDFTVLEYLGKETDYVYKIVFIETGNEEIVTRKSIIALSCVDKKKKEQTALANKKKKQQEEINRRKHMNKFKGKEVYECLDKTKIKMLSLDQSSNYTGYSIFTGGKLEYYGLIDLKTNNYSYLEKAITVESIILDLIEKYNIDLIVMEDIYLGMNLEVYKVLCTIQSHLMISLIKNKKDYIIVSAPQWKSFQGITIKSRDRETQKKLSVSLAKSKFQADCETDDVADSILIGDYAYNECVKTKANPSNAWDIEAY